jgi:hypothetical protein
MGHPDLQFLGQIEVAGLMREYPNYDLFLINIPLQAFSLLCGSPCADHQILSDRLWAPTSHN